MAEARVRLAFRVGVGEKTVLTFESGEPWSRPLDLGLVREMLESAGVIFRRGKRGKGLVQREIREHRVAKQQDQS